MLTRIPGRSIPVSYSLAASEHSPAGNTAPKQTSVDANSLCAHLTPRQRDVLAVMLQGKSNKAICRALNLAEPTVKNHVTAILKTLNVTNRTEAVIKVSQASVTTFTSLLSYSCTAACYSPPKQR